MKLNLGRYFRYQYFKMLRVKDTPSKVAQGAGLGFAMDFAVPIPLISIFFAFLLSRILKMNSLASVISATSLKPFFPAIVFLNLYVKSIIVTVFPVLGTIVLPRTPGTTIIQRLADKLLASGVPYLMAGLVNGALVFMIADNHC